MRNPTCDKVMRQRSDGQGLCQVRDARRPEGSATLWHGGNSMKDEPSPAAALGQGGRKSPSPGAVLHFLQ